ncbi:MAG: glycosyltransferase [Candidatus Bathyarchaeia archaeon]
MRILMLHNYYQHWGGEDASTEQELRLLRRHGHEVLFYSRHNNEIKSFSLFRKALLFFEASWSLKSYNEIKKLIRDFQPDVAHFHNFFPLISPSAYYACAEMGIPVIQTLHDYRLLCPTGWLFRDGRVCEDCFSNSLWHGIKFGCYHNSRTQTAAVALMLKTHRILRTWYDKVDAFIALTDFSRRKFIEAGIPKFKIFVRPNFLEGDPGIGESSREYALFVGRLSPEKGLETLLKAWHSLPDIPLKIIGDGPMRSWVEEYIKQNRLKNIELIGFVRGDLIWGYLKKAFFLIIPSVWYECLPRTIIEAYATGTPVIASRLGSMEDLVEDGRTGLLFNPGAPNDLAAKVRFAVKHPNDLMQWGQRARYVFEQKYSSDNAYNSLMEIYARVTGK